MNGKVFKKSASDTARGAFALLLITLAVIVMIMFGLRQTEASSRAEGLRLLEESIRRAALQCYVVEGSYPESVSYIEAHYGVYIDRTRYAVFYEIFAPNHMPDITVVELEGNQRK